MFGRRPFAMGLAFGVAALVAACTYSDSNVPRCVVAFRGACEPGPGASLDATPQPSPAVASPAVTSPSAASPAAASRPAVPLGNPADFADVDDRQCRSYGLTFGSRDYADRRIRLSAQHRGLDPNIGTTPPSR